MNIDPETLVRTLKSLPETYAEKRLRKILQQDHTKVDFIVKAVRRLENWQACEEENKQQRNTIIFDFGGVLMDYSDDQWDQAMAEKARLSVDQIKKFRLEVVPRLMSGELSEPETIKMLYIKYGVLVDPTNFFEINMKLNKDMIVFVKRLIENGLTVGVLTNTIPSHWIKIKDMLIAALPELNPKHIFASCELGLCKTGQKAEEDRDIFRIVLNKLGKEANQAIYIDDNPAYTHQARENGIYALEMRAQDSHIQERIVMLLAQKIG